MRLVTDEKVNSAAGLTPRAIAKAIRVKMDNQAQRERETLAALKAMLAELDADPRRRRSWRAATLRAYLASIGP